MNQEAGLRTVFVNERATSRQLRKAKVVVVDGPDEGKEFVIGKSKFYVGRSAVTDFKVADKSISGTHFEIRAEEDGFLLRDMGSTNGTWVAGCRVREIYLAPNVTFRAGNTTFRLTPIDEIVEIALSEEEHFGGVIGRSVAMREVFATLSKIAPSELTCMIEGDTGTGKERMARAIHDKSRRKSKPFVVLDCSSIPRELMESYVFGHERGAFTGAVNQHKGAFEQANGGTLFLDEIGELDLALQPKLLRVLENREYMRVGGTKLMRTDCRIIAATNRDLRVMVNEGAFREDLYFRLSVIQIYLPSLAKRREDIPLMVEHFFSTLAERRPDLQRLRMTADAMDMLMSYPWPGNVRELRNVIERAASLASGPAIERSDLHLSGYTVGGPTPLAPPVTSAGPADPDSSRIQADLTLAFKDAKQQVVDQFEYDYLDRIIDAHDGNISRAAKQAGLTRFHMRELLKKHDLKK
ncbi:MAG: sigma 54-dependent Fis family transcriptional regulator [Bradymonadaceae bacterium]|nr:sigma 54-dependent Fis family transcriptional regulator [Lujinxingiaceae bacterium]